MSDILQQIRDLQFTDKSGAEALLLSFIRDNFPLDVIELELTPLAVSLNSFNGFMTLANGTRRFFKTHTETDTVIDEYYNESQKIEGFFDICQARGLSGNQGVIIPHVNRKHLMLRKDVVEAVRNNQFSIYTISDINDALVESRYSQ